MDSSTSSSGLRVALLFVGGSLEVERAVASFSLLVFSLLVLVGGLKSMIHSVSLREIE